MTRQMTLAELVVTLRLPTDICKLCGLASCVSDSPSKPLAAKLPILVTLTALPGESFGEEMSVTSFGEELSVTSPAGPPCALAESNSTDC